MIKTFFLLAAFGLLKAQGSVLTPDCEVLENGCPVDFNINLLLPHETSCRGYYQCVHGEKIPRRCPRNTVFNEEKQACDHPANVDRTCEDDVSEERPPSDDESVEIEFLPNGCPANYTFNWHLPHNRYCNLYYQCVHGLPVQRICPPGLHYNATAQTCDHRINVNCTLPGGDYVVVPTERPTRPPTTDPSIDFDENGCPVDQSINWLLPHENCTKFYFCVWGDLVESNCPAGLHFNPREQYCDNPATAGCINFPCYDQGPCTSTAEPEPTSDGSEEDLPPGGDDEGPPVGTDAPPTDAPPVTTVAPPVTTVAPPVTTVAPPVTTVAPPVTTVAPPVTTLAPPVDPDDCDNGSGGGPGCDCEDTPGDRPDDRCVDECQVLPWAHEDCDKFWLCYGNRAILGVCSNGLFFNPSTSTCDFACNVDCDSGRVRITPNNEGLKMYIPWNKFDDNARQLLKAIGH